MVEDQIENIAAKPSDEPLMISTMGDKAPEVPEALKEESSSDSVDDTNGYEETEMNNFGFFSDSSD